MDENPVTFESLGVANAICKVCAELGWKHPTPIQKEVIPAALDSKDIIGIAETGSGKTAAFAIPIIQELMEKPVGLFALVLVPTRELAEQVSEQFKVIGAGMKLTSAVLVGGQDETQQRILLAKRPHVVVATPGRILDHLTNMRGLKLNSLKYLVLDEADRMLSDDFEGEVNQILAKMPKVRRSYLFSATMSGKVERMKRLALRNPVKVEIASKKLQRVENLTEHLIFCAAQDKDLNFCFLLSTLRDKTIIVFCDTRASASRVWLMINFFFESKLAIVLHGELSQEERTFALNKFKNGECTILVCTDVCSRGIDIPNVDVVINLDIPKTPEAYTHRVGRTARAGRSGVAYILVNEYDVGMFLEMERHRDKIPKLDLDEAKLQKMAVRVAEARTSAKSVINEIDLKKRKRKKGRTGNEDDDEDDDGGVTKRLKTKNKKS